ncbi:MAG: hypothetical protein VKM92_02030, partial [Cyanobacteriota bacterium]|nr:hypothetical protein [Cyanobacteriota bacterium]
AMKQAEAQGARPRRQPWKLPEPLGPVCGLPPRLEAGSASAAGSPAEVAHPRRRRRSGRQLAEL